MYHNHVFTNASKALPRLLHDLLVGGEEVGSRAGRVRELTHIGITLTQPWQRELLVQHRKPNIAAQIAETVWVLAGRNDIGFLSNYLPRAANFSDDGKTWRAGYGARLRHWPDHAHAKNIDQLAEIVRVLREQPLSRQAVASIWDPESDYEPSKDIPCNNWLSFSSRLGKLDLHVAIRSNDAMWGWSGINAFEWSALQEIVAGLLGVEVGGLHFSTTSFHLYDQHWEKARRIVEKPVPWSTHDVFLQDSPRFKLGTDSSLEGLDLFDDYIREWLRIEELIRQGQDMGAAVDTFPEPMLQSWLRVIQWWWTGEREYLSVLEGTRLEMATRPAYSVQPPEREFVDLMADEELVRRVRVDRPQATKYSAFIIAASELHISKHVAYGDSWKKRGEQMSIMANIARKVDRLGGAETEDETSSDTAMDLMIYLAKYMTWLEDEASIVNKTTSDTPREANRVLQVLDASYREWPKIHPKREELESALRSNFDALESAVKVHRGQRREIVEGMLEDAYVLARKLWDEEQAVLAKRDKALQNDGDDYRGADVD